MKNIYSGQMILYPGLILCGDKVLLQPMPIVPRVMTKITQRIIKKSSVKGGIVKVNR